MIDIEKEMQPMITASEEFMNKLVSAANVNAVFGEPVQRGDTVVIPCAEISIGGGMGVGSGSDGGNEPKKLSWGTGAGGGTTGHPLAIIVISPEGVRVQPIMDMTKVALAVFTTATFMVLQLVRLSRAGRAEKGKEPSLAQLKRAFKR